MPEKHQEKPPESPGGSQPMKKQNPNRGHNCKKESLGPNTKR